MDASNTVSSLKASASVAAAVPVAGPALGAILQVAAQACEALEGVKANREEYAKLAGEVWQQAQAVSAAVQSDLKRAPGSQTMADQRQTKVEDEIEKLTSVFSEVEEAIKMRQDKDKKHHGGLSNQTKGVLSGIQLKDDDKEKLAKLREKVESGLKTFQTRTNIQVLEFRRMDALRATDLEKIENWREECRRQDCIERQEEADRYEECRTKERWQDRVDKELDLMERKLAPVFSACFDAAGAPEPCLPQTCGALLEQIKTWASNESPSSTSMFCLTGLAGTGKTTIAQSISTYYNCKCHSRDRPRS